MKRLMILGACVPMMAFAAADGGGGSGQAPLSLAAAINALDVTRDADWTATGEPAMARIEELTGNPDLKRADVKAATPEGFNRANAAAAPTLKEDGNASGDGSSTVGTTSLSTDPDAGAAALGGGDGSTGNQTDQIMGVKLSGSAAAVAALLETSFDGDEFDAVTLMEAVVAASQSDRYARNSALQNLVRGYQVSQVQIKEVQGRLDARIADRKDKNAASRAATAAEAEG